MAIEEIRVRLREKLEGIVGAEETSYLMDRPPGGWSDLVTNQTLTDKIDALRQEMRAEMSALSASVDARLRKQTWVVTTALLSGIGAATVISTTVAALL